MKKLISLALVVMLAAAMFAGCGSAPATPIGYTETLRDVIAVNTTNGPRGAIHAISSVSRNPGVALQVLDIVNSDTTVHNLLVRGVEGIHYNLENGKKCFIWNRQ
jgi:hypothetical protein